MSQSMRTVILKRMTKTLEQLPEGKDKEKHKGKIFNFLKRCQKQDGKRSKRSNQRDKIIDEFNDAVR